MNVRHFYAVLRARNNEFFRDRAALAWTILFPVFVVFGFAFMFSDSAKDQYKIGVYGEADKQGIFTLDYLNFVPVTDLARAETQVARHQLDLLLDTQSKQFWVNQQSPKSYLAEQILRGSELGVGVWQKQQVSGREIRYVDWLLPGMLGMNMMFAALWGVGFVIVRYRHMGVLKRLQATPLTPFEFLSAQLVSRLLIILVLTSLIYLGCDLLLDFAMFGSYWHLLLVFALGSTCMIALSLTVTSWTANQEVASGLLNMLSWPMMLLSGIWFSTEGMHPVMKFIAYLFPLTYVVDACRAIMIDGAGLQDLGVELSVLGVLSVLFLAIGTASFRWK